MEPDGVSHVYAVLNVDQFQRFMSVIKTLSDRVEREHLQHLKDSQRVEDRSVTSASASQVGNGGTGGLDFASLVAGAKNTSVKPDTVVDNGKSWDDDVWGSILGANDVCDICYFLDLLIIKARCQDS